MTPAALKAERTRLGLTQVQLAAALGITAQCVSNWEAGRRAPQHPVMLARALEALDKRQEHGYIPYAMRG